MMHRPWWKVVINTALRIVQPGARRKWLVASVFDGDKLIGYTFARIEHTGEPAPWGWVLP